MALILLKEEKQISELMNLPKVLVYKHSPTCAICSFAIRQVHKFIENDSNTPVYMVNVLSEWPLSGRLAEISAIRHESPQLILFKNGRAVWNRSHFGIKQKAIEEAVNGPNDL